VQRREQVDPALAKVRCARLKHRGPDDSGLWLSSDGRVCFAHRRLSIIDLSSTGHQPMGGGDGFVLIFNGEIYNFGILRTELEMLGYRFEGTSDTEVLLAAYRAWGVTCVDHFNGMFAFAIFDRGDGERGSSIFLARDRVGEKPLYYALNENRLQFASELKAIEGGSDVDLVALEHYLALGYVPGALCLASGVAKLPPGHAARLNIDSWDWEVWRYWELPLNSPDAKVDSESLADEAERLLRDSVKLRLVADVPIGVLLSGGLDSSLVVAAAAEASSKPLKTFTVSVPGTRLDELPFARKVAKHFGTEHHVLSLDEPSLGTIEELAPFVDEPIGDSSILPTFLVSKLARLQVKVGLAGDGGDEIFGGYPHYAKALSDWHRLGWVPASLWRFAAGVATQLPAGVKGRRAVSSMRNGPLEQNLWGTNFFDPTLRRRLVPSERPGSGTTFGSLQQALPETTIRKDFLNGQGSLDRMLRADFYGQLGASYLVKIDRASMAHGLELRVPMLDSRLVEFCFASIPDSWKVSGGVTRRVERVLAKRMLPSDFITNRKQGFSVPLEDWFRSSNCRIVRDYIRYLPAAIVRTEVEGLIDGHMRGRSNGARLFCLLMLAIAAKNNAWA
jgi:asparagine synthase (glutamine-hydrolysing)